MTYHNRPIYATRPINKENFHPAVHALLLSKGLLNDCVQIYVDVVGGREWINVRKDEVTP
jgi:hypothetical protein